MTRRRKSRSVQATEEGIRILKESKAANRDSEGRRLTFERIAEKAGLDPKTVKTFFYGGGVDPESASAIAEKGFGLKVTDIVGIEAWNQVCSKSKLPKHGHTEAVENTVLAAQISLEHHNNIPRSGAVEFVGRTEQLSELHQLLEKNNQVVIAAIAGMGGVGKTELAIQYAQRHTHTYKGGICWLYPKRGDIGVQIVEFAIAHFQNFTLPNGLTTDGKVQFCWQRWAEGQVLIVIDDVVDYRGIKFYLPSESRFKVLITMRENLGKPLASIDLYVLKPKAALALLESLVGRERLKREPWVARNLCKWLEYLPLGLELVGNYLVQNEDLSLAEMLRRLKRKRLRHPAMKNPKPTMTAQLGVADAFELSWERLDDAEQRLGCLLSLFAPAPIPWKLNELQLAVSEADAKVIKESLEAQGITHEMLEELENSLEATAEAKNKLVRLNLLQPCGEGIYRFHQLIREFFRQKLEAIPEAEELKSYFVGYMAALAKQIPSSPNHDDIKIISPFIPHLEEVVQEMSSYLSDREFGYPFNILVSFYENQGLYALAEDRCLSFIESVKLRFPGNYVVVAGVEKKLALILRLQGRYGEAETIYKKVLEAFMTRYNKRHSVIIYIQYEIAVIYLLQDRINEAESLLKNCLHCCIQEIEDNSLDIVDEDSIYKRQDNFSNNEKLVVKTLSFIENYVDKYSDVLITVLNTLGSLYKAQGRYREAEVLLEKTLDRVETLFDSNPTRIAVYKAELGLLYKLQNKYKNAESLLLQSLDTIKIILGENHPDIVPVLQSLGNLYRLKGEPIKAEICLKQALEITKKFLGEDNPDYADNLNELGLLYTELGSYKEAEPLLIKSLYIREKLIGKNNSGYAATLNNLGLLYWYRNQYKQAEARFIESLQIRTEILGEQHPDVASSFHNLANLYRMLEKFDEAEELWKKAFNIALKTLGQEHEDTIMYQKILLDLPLVRTIPTEFIQRIIKAFPGRFALADLESKIKKVSNARSKA